MERKNQTHLDTILPTMKTLAITKKDDNHKNAYQANSDQVKNEHSEGTTLTRRIWMKCYQDFCQ